MREDSPRWEQINASAYLHEQDGLRELASYLPDADPYHVWANIEFVAADGSINEVDALVLTPSGLYVLELKHWQGELRGDGNQWVRRAPNSRLIPEDNPYVLANRKAKRLASLISHYARRQGRSGPTPYVAAAVFLHATNLTTDLDSIGRQHVYGLDGRPESGLPGLREMLVAQPRNPAHRIDPERGREIVDLVKGAKIRPSVANRKVGQLLIHARPMAEGPDWQDFLAGHVLDTVLLRRVRFYLTSRAAEEDVPVIRAAAEREFRLLQGIHHPGIAGAHDLVEHAWGPAVVFDHEKEWVRLDHWLLQQGDRPTLAQRLHLIGDLAEIIDYAHSRRLAHRALHPGAIYVCDPDSPRPRLVVTNWQTGGRLPASTRMTSTGSASDPSGLELFYDDEVRRYQAPEVVTAARPPGHQLDVFSLGTIAYRIFAGSPPAASAEELATAVRDSGVNLAAAVDGMPSALVDAVYGATRGDPAQRLASVAAFRNGLELVWEEVTAPEPEPVVDPLTARRGDWLNVGLKVESRLGAGGTAVALLVEEPGEGEQHARSLVLKVARDERHSDRLAAEAETLRQLRHPQVVAIVKGPIEVGGRTSLLMESAGSRTLAEELRDGRFGIDLLERYGRDLLEIVAYLDGQGVWHRDLKPANLAARPRPKDKQPHLCVFDFSLSSAPADQYQAGTTGYLDPFLGGPLRPRYDAAAERFSAAVTLFEMATGTLPQWGGANPASVSGEVTLDPAMFDQDVADRMVDFFGRALAREVGDRFHTIDEMIDEWRAIFRAVPRAGVAATDAGVSRALTRMSPLSDTDLTARARSALERLGFVTVGDLLDAPPSELTRARNVPDATRKEILAQVRALRAAVATPETAPESEAGPAQAVETLSLALLPAETARNRKTRTTLAVLLGQSSGDGDALMRWPTQSEAARLTGQTQPQVSVLLRRQIKQWTDLAGLAAVRDEIVSLLDARGSVMSAVEIGEALVATRGSYTPEPKRTTQAIGLVRAAVEVELSLGGDSRVAIQRFRQSETVLVGREPDDPTSEVTAADLLSYVVALGERATVLAGADPLPSKQRAVEDLRTLPKPDGMPAIADLRLLQLAAAGSNGRADVNAQGQLYPVQMPAERALRLTAGSLIGQKLSDEEVRGRVRARFPRAQPLPLRPGLTEMLRRCAVPLTWHASERIYAPPELPSQLTGMTGTRTGTTIGAIAATSQPDEVAAKLSGAVDRRAFLAVLTSLRRLTAVRRALLERPGLVEVDITGILLDRLRSLGYPWETIIKADNGSANDPDFRSLVEMVQHDVMPSIRQALAVESPVLITEAAPLARYGQMQVLQELVDPTRPRPAARLLLVPAWRPEPALLDGQPLPLTSPASQLLWIPDGWVNAKI